ncbi:MAG: hypothetical protein EXR59_00935 [Dehalococcoidia bacterium]|nr:hypothetical protein [Dehalococcoidia bacterium]
MKAVVASSGYIISYLPIGVQGLVPPVLILLGTADVVIPLQDARRFENALRADGKQVEVKYYEGVPHEILNDPKWGDQSRADAVEFLKRKLAE